MWRGSCGKLSTEKRTRFSQQHTLALMRLFRQRTITALGVNLSPKKRLKLSSCWIFTDRTPLGLAWSQRVGNLHFNNVRANHSASAAPDTASIAMTSKSRTRQGGRECRENCRRLTSKRSHYSLSARLRFPYWCNALVS